MLLRTLQRLASTPAARAIVVALRADDSHWADMSGRLPTAVMVQRVDGGAQRASSVLNALNAIASQAQPDDWALVHDAVRPCIRATDLRNLLTVLGSDPVGGLLAAPVRDTMKRDDGAGRVKSTEPRDGLWHALTPQVFRYGLLTAALRSALHDNVAITDEAQAVELAGYQPRLVEGSADNIKITRAQDLILAQQFLQAQGEA